MSDFREYSAAFHYQNDDILHYGVKNMKWHHHKRSAFSTQIMLAANKRRDEENRKKAEYERNKNAALEEAHNEKIMPKVGKALSFIPKLKMANIDKIMDSGKTKASVMTTDKLNNPSRKDGNASGNHRTVIATHISKKEPEKKEKRLFMNKKRGRYKNDNR